ncbi:4'-phosphopantetheinyl transferase family protein [Pseudogracilibacillus sp. SO30301A]|uniref:4'-phosphopantetheinyl transferase family protein n=1 Tax=Pseudogracilibacillus sp. SO30301A TaxID=3098291 RepID=UPI00300E011E
MSNLYNFENCFLRKKVVNPSVVVLYTHINWLPKASLLELTNDFTKHEKDKLYLFKDQLLRYEYAYSHYLLRKTLIQHCGISHENLYFYFSDEEKPKSNKVKFNLSHSHGYIALIFSKDVEVGIDVQQHQQLDIKDLQAITDSLFSRQEIQRLQTVLYEKG